MNIGSSFLIHVRLRKSQRLMELSSRKNIWSSFMKWFSNAVTNFFWPDNFSFYVRELKKWKLGL